MIEKYGFARWEGGLKDGRGILSSETGVLSEVPYTFATRFGTTSGSNPEELLGAAHAACFAMAFSAEMGKKGFTPDSVDAKSTITLDAATGTITKAHLDLTAAVPGAGRGLFDEVAKGAKAGCPVSKLFNAEITLTATLT